MNKTITITELSSKGLNTDVAPWDLPGEYITNGLNFRTSSGSVRTCGAGGEWGRMDHPISLLMPVGAGSDDMTLLAGTLGAYSFDGLSKSVLLDLSATPVDQNGWSGCMRGGIPVINHPQSGAYYWYPVLHGEDLIPLPFDSTRNWDDSLGISAKVFRSHRNFLFALNLTETIDGVSVDITDGYRWSHPADINGVPPSWDEKDQNFLAGLAQVGGDTGRIIDGLSMRDSFVIYSDHGINILELSGDVFVWNRRLLTTATGLLCRDAVVEVNGVHYLMTADDIVMCDGNSVRSITADRIRRHFRAHLNTQHFSNSYAVHNIAWREVWFCIPTTGEFPDTVYVYNWLEDSWSIRDLGGEMTFAAYGSRSKGIVTWHVLETTVPPPAWNEYDLPWGTSSITPYDDTVLSADITGKIYDVDPDSTADLTITGDGSLGSFIERTNYPLEGHRDYTTITRIYPHISGVTPVLIQVGSHDYPGSPIRWKPAVEFNPASQRKLDLRTTGALHAWRVSSIGNGNFSMSGMTIEYAYAGVR